MHHQQEASFQISDSCDAQGIVPFHKPHQTPLMWRECGNHYYLRTCEIRLEQTLQW